MSPILRQAHRQWSSEPFRIARGVITLPNVMLIFRKVTTGTGRDLIPVKLFLPRAHGIFMQMFFPDTYKKSRSIEAVMPVQCSRMHAPAGGLLYNASLFLMRFDCAGIRASCLYLSLEPENEFRSIR